MTLEMTILSVAAVTERIFILRTIWDRGIRPGDIFGLGGPARGRFVAGQFWCRYGVRSHFGSDGTGPLFRVVCRGLQGSGCGFRGPLGPLVAPGRRPGPSSLAGVLDRGPRPWPRAVAPNRRPKIALDQHLDAIRTSQIQKTQ